MATTNRATEDSFLGALLGMAIGDALGMPVAGWRAEKIAQRHGRIDDYRPRVLPDGTEVAAGEFTDESEIVLSIVASLTPNRAEPHPDLIVPRMVSLAQR